MKKRILILVVLLTTSCASYMLNDGYSYHFNLRTQYKTASTNKYTTDAVNEKLVDPVSKYGFGNSETIIYSNTNDDSYFLEIYPRSKDSLAAITNLKDKRIHYFKVSDVKKEEDGEVTFKFKYINSKQGWGPSPLHAHDFEFRITESDSLVKTVLMIEWLNKKREKFITIRQLKIKDFPANMFSVYRFGRLHPYEVHSNINFNQNGIVVSSKRHDINSDYFTYLSKIKRVNFILEPKK